MAQVTMTAAAGTPPVPGGSILNMYIFYVGGGTRGATGTPGAAGFAYNVEAGGFVATGTGLGSYVNGLPTTGTITGLTFSQPGSGSVAFAGLSLAAGSFTTFITNNQASELVNALIAGADIMTGSDGVDVFVAGGGDDVIDGRGDIDTIAFLTSSSGARIDLSVLGSQDTGGGRVTLTSVEHVVGSNHADVLTGDGGANDLNGFGGADQLNGGGGNDVLTGDTGDDQLDGGAGTDVARFNGSAVNYAVRAQPGGAYIVQDGRSGASGEGTDTLVNMERVRFADLGPTAIDAAVQPAVTVAFSQLLRTGTAGANAALATDLSQRMANNLLTPAAAVAEVIKAADATTSVATMAYEFFTGKTPSSAGLDYLVSPTGPNANNLNSAYYQGFSIENRNINFAVNLGKLGEGKDAFAAKYGLLNLHDATKAAYTTIFGSTPTEAKLAALLDASFVLNGQAMTRAGYFAYYGQDGADGIGTKAAMVGWLLAEAEKADVGTYAKSNAAYLTDLADGAAYAVDIVGVYGKPEFAFTG